MVRLAQLLGRAGSRVTIMAPEGSVLRTRFAQVARACSADPGKLCDDLWVHLQSEARYQRILLCDERMLREAGARPAPNFAGWPPWLRRGDVSRIGWMTTLAGAGVPVVPSREIVRAEDVVSAAEGRWPVVLKKNWSAGGHGVTLLADASVAERAGRGHEFPCLLQPWCEGELGTCEVVASRGRVLAWYASRTCDPWPEPFGPSSTRELFHDDALRPLVNAVAEATAFDGPCGFDWVRDPRGYRVLEFNARPTTAYHLGAWAGVDFARALRAWLEDRADRQDPRPPRGGRATVHIFPRYLTRAVARRDVRALLRCLPGMARHDLPWGDPLLLARQTARALVDGWRAGVSAGRTDAARAG